MTFTIGFHGGAGTVTGSRHLVTFTDQRVLVDCGPFQGLKKLRLLNWEKPPFDPQSIDAAVLTHTHIDHSGAFPRLVRQGYRGDILCSPPTRDLAPVLLLDAAKLQEEDAAYANRKGFSKHQPALALFTSDDARKTLRLLRPVPYGTPHRACPGVSVTFHDAGHILGSAFVEMHLESPSLQADVVFSGDVGRYDAPLHRDPDPLPACDVLLLESTYGDREHDDTPLVDQLCGPVCETLEKGGTVLIPAFAMARIQVLTVALRRLMASGELPTVPVHIDSPMAVEITETYRTYAGSDSLDDDVSEDEWARLFPKPREGDPDGPMAAGLRRKYRRDAREGKRHGLSDDEWKALFPPEVHLHRTVEESRRINGLGGGRIIISSSGMLTGGRVVHHLRRLLPDARNLIALAGYQAPGTRGRALLEGARSIRMHGEDIPARAKIIALHGLSSHADANDLVRWLRTASSLPKLVFVTHGEPAAAEALARRLRTEFTIDVRVPQLYEIADLRAAIST
jgi:metallo-beta-lactamase family protein